MPLRVAAADHVDAELLHDVAADFGDRDLQHHLVFADDLDQVDDAADLARRVGIVDVDAAAVARCGRRLRILARRRFTASHQHIGDLCGAAGVERRVHRSGQDDVVVDQFNFDIGRRNEALDVFLDAGGIALDREVEADDLLSIRPEDEDVGFANRFAEKIDAARGARDGVGDCGVGDKYVIGVGGQVDDDGFVQPELDVLGCRHRADMRLTARVSACPLQARAGQKQAERRSHCDCRPSAPHGRQNDP